MNSCYYSLKGKKKCKNEGTNIQMKKEDELGGGEQIHLYVTHEQVCLKPPNQYTSTLGHSLLWPTCYHQ